MGSPNFSISCVTGVIHGVTRRPTPQGKESMFHIEKKPVVAQWAGWERAGGAPNHAQSYFHSLGGGRVDHQQVAATTANLRA